MKKARSRLTFQITWIGISPFILATIVRLQLFNEDIHVLFYDCQALVVVGQRSPVIPVVAVWIDPVLISRFFLRLEEPLFLSFV